jgi:hypothetical protein
MCKTVATLAKIDRLHRLTCCDHGIVHLVWHTLSISMTEDDFHTLAEEIDYAAGFIRQGFDKPSPYVQRVNNRVHVEFEDFTLRIHINMFDTFVTMFARGAERLHSRGVRQLVSAPTKKGRIPYRAMPSSFSFSPN